jgi:hypothetical protein
MMQFLQQLAVNQSSGALYDAVGDAYLLGGLTASEVAATRALVLGAWNANTARALPPLCDAGVRAADGATRVAQNTWLGGSGFTHVHQFAVETNNGPTWAACRAWIDVVNARFAGLGVEQKWTFPICTTAEPIAQTIAGTHDATILDMARAIVAAAPAGARYIDIRPGWEPNFSTSFPWGATLDGAVPATYIAAFRHVALLLRAVDARIRIGYCPAFRLDGAYSWQDRYPGDDVVDLITPDVYCLDDDKGAMTNQEHAEFMFSSVGGLLPMRDFARARGKRMGIAEWGLDYDNPLFIERMADFIRTEAVEFHGYWDQNNGIFQCKLSGDQWPTAALAFVRNFGPVVIDTWGISALPGQRLVGEIQANKPLAKIEIISGNTGGVSVRGNTIIAEPQLSGTRRITVKAYDERGQTSTRSIVLTWQSGRLWTPVELTSALVDWYALDFHGAVSRHINAIKSLTPISNTRSATPSSSTLRPTFGITAGGVPRASFDGGDAAIQTDLTGTPGSQSAVTYAMQYYTDAASGNFTYMLSESDSGASVRAIGFNAGNLRIASTGGYAGPAISGLDASIVVSFGAGATAACRGSVNGGTASANNVTMPVATFTRRVIGGNAGGSNVVGSYCLGALSELVVMSGAATVGQEDFLHGYMAWKYGNESALPGGHAYKSNPPMA